MVALDNTRHRFINRRRLFFEYLLPDMVRFRRSFHRFGVACSARYTDVGANCRFWRVIGHFFLAQWLFYLRPRQDAKALAEAKKEIVGQIGVAINFNNGEGKMRLQKPIGRRDVWKFKSSQAVKPGDRVSAEILGENGYVIAKKED